MGGRVRVRGNKAELFVCGKGKTVLEREKKVMSIYGDFLRTSFVSIGSYLRTTLFFFSLVHVFFPRPPFVWEKSGTDFLRRERGNFCTPGEMQDIYLWGENLFKFLLSRGTPAFERVGEGGGNFLIAIAEEECLGREFLTAI